MSHLFVKQSLCTAEHSWKHEMFHCPVSCSRPWCQCFSRFLLLLIFDHEKKKLTKCSDFSGNAEGLKTFFSCGPCLQVVCTAPTICIKKVGQIACVAWEAESRAKEIWTPCVIVLQLQHEWNLNLHFSRGTVRGHSLAAEVSVTRRPESFVLIVCVRKHNMCRVNTVCLCFRFTKSLQILSNRFINLLWKWFVVLVLTKVQMKSL